MIKNKVICNDAVSKGVRRVAPCMTSAHIQITAQEAQLKAKRTIPKRHIVATAHAQMIVGSAAMDKQNPVVKQPLEPFVEVMSNRGGTLKNLPRYYVIQSCRMKMIL